MHMVDASKDEAALAVRLYNDPSEPRSFEGFVVHMHLAWLYLLHAELTNGGVDYRYWTTVGKVKRLVKIGGEPKRWELARCVEERWPSEKDPVRANLGFFIGLRNKVEHRYAGHQEALAAAVGGQSQAFLLNYEEELTAQFGVESSMATRLRFPVFIGSFTEDGEKALQRLRSRLPAALRTFIADYDAGLEDSITSDSRYELRLRVLQELAPKTDKDALAIQFTRFDDLTAEERRAVEGIGKKGFVVVREQKRGVVGHGLMKPTEAAQAIEAALPFKFTSGLFTKSWKKLGVRPPVGDAHPERTNDKYCYYDERHKDYGYTPAYVAKIVRECDTEDKFRSFLDTAPRDKETGAWVGEPPPGPPWARRKQAPDGG